MPGACGCLWAYLYFCLFRLQTWLNYPLNSMCVFLSVCGRAQVYEAVPCHSDCSQYMWRIEPWSMCTINSVGDLTACGEGVQSRKIRSVGRLDLYVQQGLPDTSCSIYIGLTHTIIQRKQIIRIKCCNHMVGVLLETAMNCELLWLSPWWMGHRTWIIVFQVVELIYDSNEMGI